MYGIEPMVLELDESGDVINKYIRGKSLIKTSDDIYYIHDGHGDIIQLANSNGDVIQDYEYDAFGVEKTEEASEATALYNPFRYCGEYFDEELGCIYLRARYYDPKNGRMISEDPYWRALDKPTCDINAIRQSINLYGYCLNNPISFTDPSGLDIRILVNIKAAVQKIGGKKTSFGHMGVLVQDKEKNWHYFSCGINYVQFDSVGEEDLQDLETFSKKYYGGYKDVGAYNKSVYIPGDFTKAYDFYYDYEYNNKKDKNASSYDALNNNCSSVVLEGFYKGILNDGTNVSSFVTQRMGYQYSLPILPKWQIGELQHIFYNDAFTYDEYHKQLNDKLWEFKNAANFWNRSKTNANFIERII